MEAKLFQYAIIWNPNKEQEKNGEKPKLLQLVETIVAKDEKAAFMIAARDIPDEYINQLDQVQIAVRPF